jgi:hypothetical protein
VGWTNSFGAGDSDVWILKTDSSGNIQWQKVYGSIWIERAYAIQQTIDGGYVVAATSTFFGAGYGDFWILKLDSLGNILWEKAYGTADYEEPMAIQQTTDGGFVVAGYTSVYAMYPDPGVDPFCWCDCFFCEEFIRDVWVLKLDASGNIEWQKSYGGATNDDYNDHDEAYSVQQTSDGGFVVAGYTMSFGAGNNDLWVLKLDASGIIEWQKTYGGGSNESAKSIQQTTDSGYIVAGSGFGGFWVLKLDTSGNVQWQKTYGGASLDSARSIQQAADGGYIVAGYTNSFGAGDWDFWILKLDANGEIDASCTFIADTAVTGITSTATVTDTTATVADTSVTPTDTLVPGVDSTATVNEQCPCATLSCNGITVDANPGCDSTAQTFTANTTGGVAPLTVDWDFSYDGKTFNVEATGNPITYMQPATGGYTVAARVTDSCAGAQVTICTVATTVSPNPTASIWEWGCACENVVLDANPAGGVPPYTYLWSTGETTQTIQVPSCFTGPYSVTVTDANGCSGSDSGFFALTCCDTFPGEPSASGVPPLIVEDPAAAQITLEKISCNTYNLHVGRLSDLAAGFYDTTVEGTTCYISAWTDNGDGTVTLDVTIPDNSWFVFSGNTMLGQSSVGLDSDGTERTSMGVWSLCGPVW